MNTQTTETATDIDIDSPEPPCSMPPHPLFEGSDEQASFVGCLDAINRVASIIELCDFLKIGDDERGLTPKAAFGHYLLLLMLRSTLSYVSKRLSLLNREQREKHGQDTAYLSALFSALSTLDSENRDQLLNHTAAHMDIPRSTLDQFIQQVTAQ